MQDNNNMQISIKEHIFAINLSKLTPKNNAHKQLYKILDKTKDDWYQPLDDGKRNLLFVRSGDVLFARSRNEPVDIPFKTRTTKVKEGEKIGIQVRLPATRRVQDNDGSVKQVDIATDQMLDHAKMLVEKCGLSVENIWLTINPKSMITFQKKGRVIVVPSCDVKADVVINDVSKFAEAYKYGMGRYKTYGCGMVVVGKPHI